MMSNRRDDLNRLSDRRLAKLAGEQIAAAEAARLEQLRQHGESLELDWEHMQAVQQKAWAAAENERKNEAYSGRRVLRWLGNYAATAAVLVLLLVVSSSATAFALGRDGLVGCDVPERQHDTTGLQAALAEYGIERQLAPWFLPVVYEETAVSVYEDEELRVFTALYLDKELPEFIAEGNRLPLYIVIRQHFAVENWAKEPELAIAADGEVRQLALTGLTYYIGESQGVHWLAWRQSEFECVIAGYFSAEDAERMAYLMNNQNSQYKQEV